MDKKVLIVDRDKKQIQCIAAIVRMAAASQGKRLVLFAADNPCTAWKMLKRYDIDILILDMVYRDDGKEEGSGIDLVKAARRTEKYAMLPVIFITDAVEWKECAYKELKCFGFFLKDYKEEEVYSSLKLALRYTTPGEIEKQIILRKKGVLYPVKVKEILYITVASHVLCFFLKDGEKIELPNLTMRQFCVQNKLNCMVRCNRNVLVNCIHVEKADFEECYIMIKGQEERIKIGSAYIKSVKKRFYIKSDGSVVV